MPIKITPTAPFTTTGALAVPSIYAIIERVTYARRGLFPMTLQIEVGYYANEAASTSTTATMLELNILPTNFSQQATPQAANALPLFDFLEHLIVTQLTALLPAGTTFANVA